jgi:hypothetical protein
MIMESESRRGLREMPSTWRSRLHSRIANLWLQGLRSDSACKSAPLESGLVNSGCCKFLSGRTHRQVDVWVP